MKTTSRKRLVPCEHRHELETAQLSGYERMILMTVSQFHVHAQKWLRTLCALRGLGQREHVRLLLKLIKRATAV